MISSTIITILKQLDYLIQHRKTGSPKELAQKLKVSEKCVRNYVNFLRQLGAPVNFCRKSQTYYYAVEGYFCFQFIVFEREINKEETNL